MIPTTYWAHVQHVEACGSPLFEPGRCSSQSVLRTYLHGHVCAETVIIKRGILVHKHKMLHYIRYLEGYAFLASCLVIPKKGRWADKPKCAQPVQNNLLGWHQHGAGLPGSFDNTHIHKAHTKTIRFLGFQPLPQWSRVWHLPVLLAIEPTSAEATWHPGLQPGDRLGASASRAQGPVKGRSHLLDHVCVIYQQIRA